MPNTSTTSTTPTAATVTLPLLSAMDYLATFRLDIHDAYLADFPAHAPDAAPLNIGAVLRDLDDIPRVNLEDALSPDEREAATFSDTNGLPTVIVEGAFKATKAAWAWVYESQR